MTVAADGRTAAHGTTPTGPGPHAGIDKGSPVPFYRQLKEILRADIAERGLRAGDRLPGDHELCEQYGVSRPVVRQAL